MPWASEVWARVVATNIYGDSTQSDQGNGAVIYFYPDQPVDVTEDMNDRSISTVGLNWLDGADPGGLPILDYRLTITSSDGLYNLVEVVDLSRAYVATDLSLGVTYYFEIESRNSHGYSNVTVAYPILCAIKPLIPTDVVSINSNANVII